MKRLLFLGLVLCVTALTVAGVFASYPDTPTGPLSLANLSPQQLEACGLTKLSDDEFSALLGLVTFVEAPSFLETTAFRHLERQGYRPVQILGLIQVGEDPFPKHLLLVRDAYEVHELEPFGRLEALPPPGVHWGKNTVSTWELLGPDGEVSRLWAR